MPQRLGWLAKTWLAQLVVGGAWLKQQGMLDLADYGIKRVHHGYNVMTEGLVNIHEKGDMSYRLRHGMNTECSI